MANTPFKRGDIVEYCDPDVPDDHSFYVVLTTTTTSYPKCAPIVECNPKFQGRECLHIENSRLRVIGHAEGITDE